jgi:transposase
MEVAAIVGASISSVKRWKDALEAGGLQALRPKPHPGRTPKLTASQKRELVRVLKRGAKRWGFHSTGWSAPGVKVVIQHCFQVDYHVDKTVWC